MLVKCLCVPKTPERPAESSYPAWIHPAPLPCRCPGMTLLALLQALLIPKAQLAVENLALRQEPYFGGLRHPYRRAA